MPTAKYYTYTHMFYAAVFTIRDVRYRFRFLGGSHLQKSFSKLQRFLKLGYGPLK